MAASHSDCNRRYQRRTLVVTTLDWLHAACCSLRLWLWLFSYLTLVVCLLPLGTTGFAERGRSAASFEERQSVAAGVVVQLPWTELRQRRRCRSFENVIAALPDVVRQPPVPVEAVFVSLGALVPLGILSVGSVVCVEAVVPVFVQHAVQPDWHVRKLRP